MEITAPGVARDAGTVGDTATAVMVSMVLWANTVAAKNATGDATGDVTGAVVWSTARNYAS